MMLTLAFVSTINGKITKGDDPDVTSWSSNEDQRHFKKLLSEHKVIIRSSSTYKLAKSTINLEGDTRHIIITRNPAKYEKEKVSRVLEFTSESPKQLVNRLKKKGVQKALLAAGSTIVSMFIKDNLIDKFYLTLEPKIFGRGVDMIAESDLVANFKLESVERLNNQGTLLLNYSSR